jgi:hypothetical protein
MRPPSHGPGYSGLWGLSSIVSFAASANCSIALGPEIVRIRFTFAEHTDVSSLNTVRLHQPQYMPVRAMAPCIPSGQKT